MAMSNPILEAAKIRNDAAGLGGFGASRDGGSRRHKGLDLISNPKGVVASPVSGEITKLGYPYNGDFKYRYVQIRDNRGNEHRLFYVDPEGVLEVGSTVEKGSPIGIAQDVSEKFPGRGMKPHVHYEIKDSRGAFIDPSASLRTK